ncbi:MAG: hypothetical protein U0R19_01600 [Bryobacteraceae bacterium]
MNPDLIRAMAQCNPDEALPADDPRYVDMDRIRGISVHRNILRKLATADHQCYCHVALAGHRGSGKSTELNRLIEKAQQDGFHPLYAEVTERVDPNEVVYSDLFRLMAEMLDEEFGGSPAMAKIGETVKDWFREAIEIDEETIEKTFRLSGEAAIGGSASAGGEVGVAGVAKLSGKTGLGKLLAAIAFGRKTTEIEKTQYRAKLERYPRQLRDNVNLMLDVAQQEVKDRCPKGILFVLDNIDRYPPAMVNEALVRNAGLFQGLAAHVIFTAPISLLYNPVEEQIQDRFTTETLPMAPVKTRSGQEAPEVIAAMAEAVCKRVPDSLFATPDLVKRFVLSSGGSTRDMLRLLQRALLEADDRIIEENVARAEAIVGAEFSRPVTKAQYEILARVFLEKSVDPDETGRWMLFRRQVLEYNGERWVDVHPLLQLSTLFQDALAAERRSRNLPS